MLAHDIILDILHIIQHYLVANCETQICRAVVQIGYVTDTHVHTNPLYTIIMQLI